MEAKKPVDPEARANVSFAASPPIPAFTSVFKSNYRSIQKLVTHHNCPKRSKWF